MGLKWPDEKQLPRVVDAMLTCNMVSVKVVDGVARCLTKSDAYPALKTTRHANKINTHGRNMCRRETHNELLRESALHLRWKLGMFL